ncbi:MAG: hypothetical protein K6T63_06445 [Alicyclobacillus herbarius]|uniref:hypothetical protein n=1 Tax=Alicyclobacillus herbarius TaxID=122960 RepID=UPI0023573378|nr:hypothetical protein [Alicyclobacillus herbarius]MCL6632261.1 hypothetical protein [Alicyclobacillus herbarius]
MQEKPRLRQHRPSPPDPMLLRSEKTPEAEASSVERMSNEGGVATEIPHDTQEYRVVDGQIESE